MSRTRCLFVLPSLRGGGAERVTNLLLQQLDPARFDLHLAVVQRVGPHADQLPSHVTVHDLQASRVARALMPLVRTVRRVRPEVVFSTVSHMNLATAMTRRLWPRGTRFVLRETATCRQLVQSTRWPVARTVLYRRYYRRADSIVCQSRNMYCDLQRHLRLPSDKLTVIPNPVDFEAITAATVQGTCAIEGAGPHLVAVGGLRRVKGTDRLISALPALLARRPTAQLWLLGEGPCEGALRQRAARMGIDDHVHFAGYQRNPYAWLKAADLFTMASRNESAPNALLEAVACGCPSVTTRHPGGTYEILAHLGMQDRFVKQLDAWPDAWFEPLPSGALARARQRYDVRQVIAQYAAVLQRH